MCVWGGGGVNKPIKKHTIMPGPYFSSRFLGAAETYLTKSTVFSFIKVCRNIRTLFGIDNICSDEFFWICRKYENCEYYKLRLCCFYFVKREYYHYLNLFPYNFRQKQHDWSKMLVNLVKNRVQTRRDRGFSRFRSFCKTLLIQTLLFRIWSSVIHIANNCAFRPFFAVHFRQVAATQL